ncbi:hypothetical protein HN011_003115 [Eciton burchellii]|nr:hypothetical protein HN011_003115 [Eciton burchellii]
MILFSLENFTSPLNAALLLSSRFAFNRKNFLASVLSSRWYYVTRFRSFPANELSDSAANGDTVSLIGEITMTYLSSWEEFEKGAERLYLQDPLNTRYTMKYSHNKGVLCLKLTDNRRCLQYRTEIAQDLKKMEKFIGNLMRHMASKDS